MLLENTAAEANTKYIIHAIAFVDASLVLPLNMANTKMEEATERVKDLNDWLPVTKSRKAKWWYSAFHNVTAMVGAGVLGLPYAMSQLGW